MENQELITILADLKSDIKIVSNNINAIEKHLERQNGRIGKAEEAIANALEERARNRQEIKDKFRLVDEIDTRLDLIEKEEVNHYTKCPIAPIVRRLEDESLSNKSVKKFMSLMFVSGIALGGIIISIIELIIKLE